jgi:hypothetical protein
MNIKAFSKEIADYFNLVLNDADMKRIAYLIEKYNEPVIRETVVYKDRTLRPKPLVKHKLVYVNLVTNEKVDFGDLKTLEAVYRRIDETAATMWGVDVSQLYHKTRVQEAAYARYMCFMKYTEMGVGCVKIGKRFNRDHTTILAGVQQGEDLLATKSQPFTYMYERFIEKVGDPFAAAGYSVIEEEDLMKAV